MSVEVSLVVPCLNEQEVLPLLAERLIQVMDHLRVPCEAVIVDDGSRDSTWTLILGLVQRDRRFRGVKLSRNFGHQSAVGAGMEKAVGKAVVVMDADLQDPPELVQTMLEKWRDGYHVVYAQRTRRYGENPIVKFLALGFYWLFAKLSKTRIPRNVGDFSLMDARVVTELLRLKNHSLFWRGDRCWVGFKHIGIPFERPPRAAGVRSYSLAQSMRLAANALMLYTDLPRLTPMLCAFVCIFLGISAIVLPHKQIETVMPYLVYAMIFVCLSVLGAYLRRIYYQTLNRPIWIIEEVTPSRQ